MKSFLFIANSISQNLRQNLINHLSIWKYHFVLLISKFVFPSEFLSLKILVENFASFWLIQGYYRLMTSFFIFRHESILTRFEISAVVFCSKMKTILAERMSWAICVSLNKEGSSNLELRWSLFLWLVTLNISTQKGNKSSHNLCNIYTR